MAERADEGIVLRSWPNGEGHAIVSVFSAHHGRVQGLVKGGDKKKALLQPGNLVTFVHRRRLDSQLGTLSPDLEKDICGLVFYSPARLHMLRYVGELLYYALPEEQPYPRFFDTLRRFVTELNGAKTWQRLAFLELDLLGALGFGLALTPEEAVTDAHGSPLYYVSPKTGRAVSREMGMPYHDKMLLLPKLFGGVEGGFLDVFKLTGHFLRVALAERDLPSRKTLLELGTKSDFTDA
ncbi:MAG: DNA repair protein RecO [Proteobacteria bacterium]|nr:DNA repair protein RecO [Pseudomonadota bacterium]